MKIITLQYNEFTKKYLIDYSPILGKKRAEFINLEDLIVNLTESLDKKRKIRFLLRGRAEFPEGNETVKKIISTHFRKAIYEDFNESF